MGEAEIAHVVDEVLGEAAWLASQGVTELVLVSENSTSYGKDLGDLRSLEKLLPQLAAIEGLARVRVAYLQPAELRPPQGLHRIASGFSSSTTGWWRRSWPTRHRRLVDLRRGHQPPRAKVVHRWRSA